MDIGGYTLTPADGEGLIVRVRTIGDGATPSVNGTMTGVLARLHALTGESEHAERYSVLLTTFAEDARRQPISCGTYFNGFDLVLRGMQIVIVGQRNDAAVGSFREALRRLSLPNKILVIVAPGESLHETHPARGKGQVNDRATAYLCAGQTCSQPITDPNALELQLKVRVVGALPGASART
jgi:hypothetical protein